MSQLMRAQTQTNAVKFLTGSYQPIFKNFAVSLLQAEGTDDSQIQGSSFTPSSIVPGQNTDITIQYNSNDIERDEYYWVKHKLTNSDAVNTPTFLQDCLTHYSDIIVEINGGSKKIEYHGLNAILDILSDEFRLYDCNDLNEFFALFMNNEAVGTYDGVAVANGAPKYFYYPLWIFINMIKRQITQSFIKTLKITLRATPQASSAVDSALICKSDTTANAYTTSNITFSEITFVRLYTIIRDPRLAIKTDVGPNSIVLIPQYDEKVVQNVSWNTAGTDAYTFKLDEWNRQYIGKVVNFVRPRASAYNSSSCQVKKSGHKYILEKWRQLQGDKKAIDMTKSEFHQRLYNLETQRNIYGGKLNPNVWTDTGALPTYFLNMSNIYFDYNKIEQNHGEIINNLDSTKENYELTFMCNGSVSANSDLVFLCQYYKAYKWVQGNLGMVLEEIDIATI